MVEPTFQIGIKAGLESRTIALVEGATGFSGLWTFLSTQSVWIPITLPALSIDAARYHAIGSYPPLHTVECHFLLALLKTETVWSLSSMNC